MLSGRTSGDRTTWLHAEALRWSLLAFAIAGSIAGVGHWTKTDDIRPAQPPAWADATILVGSLLALAATWWWLDRTAWKPLDESPPGDIARRLFKAPVAPLAAGAVTEVLWLPVSRLVRDAADRRRPGLCSAGALPGRRRQRPRHRARDPGRIGRARS